MLPICQNAKCCIRKNCQRNEHTTEPKRGDPCEIVQCMNVATNGPGNDRIYCKKCTSQLNLKETHTYNGSKCIQCGTTTPKPRYGYRGYPKSHCATCGKAAKLPCTSSVLCTVKLNDGSLCPKVNKGRINGKPRCAQHLKEAEKLNAEIDALVDDQLSKLSINKEEKEEKPPSTRRRRQSNEEIIANRRAQHECIIQGCTRSRQFGYESDRKRKVCPDHVDQLPVRENDSVIKCITARKCKEHNRVARYGYTETTHCEECKLPDMNRLTKQCEHDGCTKNPRFGIRDRKTGRGAVVRCGDHVEKGDAAVGDQLCRFQNEEGLYVCDSRAHKGVTTKERCSKHEQTGDKIFGRDSSSCQKCIELGISEPTRATFGYEGQKALYCELHKLKLMTNVIDPKCVLCLVTVVKKYKPHCARCYFYLNPEDPQIRQYKTREQAFMIPLKDIYSDMELDKTISGGCSKRRPDGFIDCLTHSIIIEIDEDQHAGYDHQCENRRLVELYLDTAARPVVFIRLNPDSYVLNGSKIVSAFKIENHELVKNDNEYSKRFELLKVVVAKAIANVPDKAITVVQLCFSD